MTQLIREWAVFGEQCIRESKVDRNLTSPSLQKPNEHMTAPENAMRIDWFDAWSTFFHELLKHCGSNGRASPLFFCLLDI